MYRALRRHYTKKHKKRLERIADFSGYPSGAAFIKKDLEGKSSYCDREDEPTYIKKTYRSNHGGSKRIKKQCHRDERNYDYELTPSRSRGYTHKISDYWWTLT